MATKVIIDGYNFLWQEGLFREQVIKGFDKGREALLNWFMGFPQLQDFDVIIIFDAYKTDSNHPSEEKFQYLRVVYTAGGQTADDLIRDMAAYHGPAAIIVSSDQEVMRHAEKKGCGVLTSGEFKFALQKPELFEHNPSRKLPKAKRKALGKLLRFFNE